MALYITTCKDQFDGPFTSKQDAELYLESSRGCDSWYTHTVKELQPVGWSALIEIRDLMKEKGLR